MTVSTRPRLRLLVLSWNYPTVAAPQRGLWVERMCEAIAAEADVHVIVPTPWLPPGVPSRALARFRDVPRMERRGAVSIHYPRVLGSIAYLTHSLDASLSRRAVLACARALHATRPFDVLHAHFIYPDGVIAAQIGRALRIPVMTTEHAFWTPWLIDKSRQRRQVDAALKGISLVTSVSEFLNQDVDAMVAGRTATAVLPNVVDDETFTTGAESRDPNELLYVGLVRGVKRIDVLLKGVLAARKELPDLRLRILSAKAIHAYGANRREMSRLIEELGLAACVTVVHGATPAEVANAMRRAAFVAVSSARRETFCSVAAEALACGTPLIITRCGGPEEFVTPDDGVMVDPDDPAAFAAGIVQAFNTRDRFSGPEMRSRIVARFGRVAWREQAMRFYRGLVHAG